MQTKVQYMLAIAAITVISCYPAAFAVQGNSTVPAGPQGNGTKYQHGNGTEHYVENGARYFDNGTIITKLNGRDSKFFLDDKAHFYPYGITKTKGAPDPVLPCTPNGDAPSPYQYTISRSHCGLMESDPLNNETMTQPQLEANQQYWSYDGDAPQENATYAFYRDPQGLHIGVAASSNGTYAGYFAMSANTTAALFHSIITTPVRTIPSQGNYFQNGMYVQTAQANVNYVTCVSITNNAGTVWAVVHTYGTANSAVKFDLLWLDNSQNQPLTRDCTIVTNGNNYLRVYMDGQIVYTNNTMNLQMPMPLNAYLEPESSYAGQVLYGTYNDYYETSGDNLGICSLPPGSSVAKIVNATGGIIASYQVSGGNATMDVGRFHYPINGTIIVTGASNGTVASTPNTYDIFGGDKYAVKGTPQVPSPPTGLVATAVSPTQIDISWNAPSSNGGEPITGYKVERLQGNSTVWYDLVPDSNSTVTTYSDANLVTGVPYYYRVSAINGAGAGSSSNLTYAVPYNLLSLSRSGLVASDPLDNQSSNERQLLSGSSFWTYGGSATGENATYDIFEDQQGLHIAVKAKTNGTYAGYQAATPPLGAALYHAVVEVKTRALNATGMDFQGGLYVEDPNQVNYVTCVAITEGDSTYWSVVQSTGNPSSASSYNTLYTDKSPDQPLKRDCTIVTNGNNFLAVYLDHSKVYTGSSLNLQLRPAGGGGMQGILESESSYAHVLLQGIYSGFYATSEQSMTINNMPPDAATAEIVNGSGAVVASSQVSSGVAHINLAKYLQPLDISVRVYDTNNVLVATTQGEVKAYGGDVYTIK